MRILLEISIMGSVMVLLILLARMVLQNRVRRSTILLLWMIALARFLIPVTISSPASVYNLSVFETPAEVVVTQAEEVTAGPIAPTQPEAPAVQTHSPQETLSLGQVLSLVWLCGTVTVLAVVGIGHCRALGKYRFAIPAEPLPVAIPSGVRVRTLDTLAAPLTYGFLRPVILLPPELVRQGGDRLEHILRHELAHIRHHDVTAKGLFLLAAAIHWYNPLVWVMVCVASRDMEMRCDEEVVRELGKAGQLSYAKTLVSVEESKLTGYLQTGFSFGSTAARLKAMLEAKTSVVLSVIAAISLSLCLIISFSTVRAVEPGQPSAPTEAPTEMPTQSEETQPSTESPFADTTEIPEWETPMMKEPVNVWQTEPPTEPEPVTEPETEPMTEPKTVPETEPPVSPETQPDTDDGNSLFLTWEDMSEEQQQLIQQQTEQIISHYAPYYQDYSLLDTPVYGGVTIPGSPQPTEP